MLSYTQNQGERTRKNRTQPATDFDQMDKKTRQKGATKKQKLGRSLDIYTQIKKHCLLQPDHTKVQQCSSFIICRRELHIHLLDKLSSQAFNFRLHLLDLVQVFLALKLLQQAFREESMEQEPGYEKKKLCSWHRRGQFLWGNPGDERGSTRQIDPTISLHPLASEEDWLSIGRIDTNFSSSPQQQTTWRSDPAPTSKPTRFATHSNLANQHIHS